MIERVRAGEVPRKHHTALRGPDGALRYEECFTRDGFESPYTILYHQGRPHAARVWAPTHGWALPSPRDDGRPLARRHYLTDRAAVGGAPVDARVPLLANADVVVSIAAPDRDDPVWLVNADHDELFFALDGGGTLHSPLGDLAFGARDYVMVPKGLPYRFSLAGPQRWLVVECRDFTLPRQWRNEAGQLRMDAPFCHRDFRAPVFRGPTGDGPLEVLVKREDRWHGFVHGAPLTDVVGWDGSVWPFAFAITDFQPRVGLVHLPPTWHGTFACKGALVCSFVPRPVDFHPAAVPCPYPHTSVDCDEVIYYCDGNFTSRKGVGPGSVSHHPTGVPHGPHPGAYEASVGTTHTTELAVMLDTARPLWPTAAALGVEDAGYHDSFLDPREVP